MSDDLKTGKRISRLQFDWRSSLGDGIFLNLASTLRDSQRLRLVLIEAIAGKLGTQSGSLSFVVCSETASAHGPATSHEWERLGVNTWNIGENPPFIGFECQVSGQWGSVTFEFNTNSHFVDTVFSLIKNFILHFEIAKGAYEMWPSELRRVLEKPERDYEYFHVHEGRAMQFGEMVRELLK